MTKKAFLWIIPVLFFIAGILYVGYYNSANKEPIKVGVLHSLSGVMAMSESQLADASLMAIDEINREGGLLGQRIKPIMGDGRSDWPTFAAEAERMITREKVCAIFGGYTSASRKEVKPVVEKYNNLFFYPVPYEGVEESPNIVYNGASPNQLYIPAIKWCFDKLGKRFFLIGSDYIWPRTVNVLIKDLITALRGEILGEEYLLVGSNEVSEAVEKIALTQPDVIVSTIVGTTNIPFYEELRKAGITSAQIPTMAFGISEVELAQMNASHLAGNYSCWSYFQSVNTESNRQFVSRFKERYGEDRVVNDSIEAGYFGVRIWAQAVRDAGTTDTDDVRRALADQSYEAPGGIVFIDGENLHTWKTVRISRIRDDGQFDIVWSSKKPVRPVPYPIYRSKSEWKQLVEDLYAAWGGAWSNPGK
jgi:urea transport system substrate-binding protein